MTAHDTKPDPADRVDGFLDVGELDTAHALWLTSGGGLADAVRSAVITGNAQLLDRLNQSDIAEWITDSTRAIDPTGTHVASRVAVLLAAAQLALWTGGPVDERVAAWTATLLAESDWRPEEEPAEAANAVALLDAIEQTQPGTTGAARHLIVALSATTELHAAVTAAAEFPVSRLNDGDIYTLTLTEVPGPLTGPSQDLYVGLFTKPDPAFTNALEAAWQAAAKHPCAAVWAVRSSRTGLPVDGITGASVGLAAAIAVASLHDQNLAKASHGWLFTGQVQPDGTVTTLRTGHGADEYRQKLVASSSRRVLAPHTDIVFVGQLADDAKVARLAGISTIDQALETLNRHHAADTAFSVALTASGPRPAPSSQASKRRRRWLLPTVASGLLIFGFAIYQVLPPPKSPGPPPTTSTVSTVAGAAVTTATVSTVARTAVTTVAAAVGPATTLQFGETVSGHTQGFGSTNVPMYQVTLDTNQRIRVTATGTPALSAIAFFGPEPPSSDMRNDVCFGTSKKDGVSRQVFSSVFTAGSAGTFHIQVRPLTSGTDYTITVTILDPTVPTAKGEACIPTAGTSTTTSTKVTSP
jgi:hypothetical protein